MRRGNNKDDSKKGSKKRKSPELKITEIHLLVYHEIAIIRLGMHSTNALSI